MISLSMQGHTDFLKTQITTPVQILWKVILGKKTKFPFYGLDFVMFCFASIRKRNNAVVFDLRLSSVRTEADLFPIWHWDFGPKCSSLQQFPSLPWHWSALSLVLYLHFHDYLIQMNCFLTHLGSIESYTKKIIWDVPGFVRITTAKNGLRYNSSHLCCS